MVVLAEIRSGWAVHVVVPELLAIGIFEPPILVELRGPWIWAFIRLTFTCDRPGRCPKRRRPAA